MRRALPLLLLLTAVAGCGGSETAPTGSADPAPISTPSQAEVAKLRALKPPLIPAERVPLAVRRQLEAGEVGLFDAFGRTSIEPERVDFAQDASLEDVRWRTWGPGGGRGTGTLRTNDCDPNCAEGSIQTVRATIALDAAKACKGQRYFAGAEIVPETGEPPFSYVRAPC